MQNPNKPIWFGEKSVVETIDLSEPKPESKSPHKIMVCTPVHSVDLLSLQHFLRQTWRRKCCRDNRSIRT